ncbi:hypothetical protein [Bifidobacterium saguini]|uniref:hypothetical protein n=1 Tax=Bifidobacterium saguini TaxID=762210 RepID=UPI001269A70A|nr:hypothetical protein [Bifidobacterium saguini]
MDDWRPWMESPVHKGIEDGVEWRVMANDVFFAWQGYAQRHVWRNLTADDIAPLVDVYGGITYGPDRYGWIGFDTLQGNSSMIRLDGTDLDEPRRVLCARMGWPWVEPHKWTCDEVEAETRRMAACIAVNDTRL